MIQQLWERVLRLQFLLGIANSRLVNEIKCKESLQACNEKLVLHCSQFKIEEENRIKRGRIGEDIPSNQDQQYAQHSSNNRTSIQQWGKSINQQLVQPATKQWINQPTVGQYSHSQPNSQQYSQPTILSTNNTLNGSINHQPTTKQSAILSSNNTLNGSINHQPTVGQTSNQTVSNTLNQQYSQWNNQPSTNNQTVSNTLNQQYSQWINQPSTNSGSNQQPNSQQYSQPTILSMDQSTINQQPNSQQYSQPAILSMDQSTINQQWDKQPRDKQAADIEELDIYIRKEAHNMASERF